MLIAGPRDPLEPAWARGRAVLVLQTAPDGTAAVRVIVREAHGGRLWAENNPGGGATFIFTLPAGAERP